MACPGVGHRPARNIARLARSGRVRSVARGRRPGRCVQCGSRLDRLREPAAATPCPRARPAHGQRLRRVAPLAFDHQRFLAHRWPIVGLRRGPPGRRLRARRPRPPAAAAPHAPLTLLAALPAADIAPPRLEIIRDARPAREPTTRPFVQIASAGCDTGRQLRDLGLAHRSITLPVAGSMRRTGDAAPCEP